MIETTTAVLPATEEVILRPRTAKKTMKASGQTVRE